MNNKDDLLKNYIESQKRQTQIIEETTGRKRKSSSDFVRTEDLIEEINKPVRVGDIYKTSEANKYVKKATDISEYNPQKGLELCSKAIALDSTNKEAYYLKGIILDLEYSSPKAALEDFSKVINIDPTHYKGWYSRGICKKKLEDYKGAIEDYCEAIKQISKVEKKDYEVFDIFYSIYINRGNAKQKLNDLQGSINDYNLALKIDLSPSEHIQKYAELRGFPLPNNSLAYFNRGNSYTLLKDYQAALEDYKKAIDLTPDMLYVGRLAEVYQKIGLYREAIKYFNVVLEIQPNSEEVITQIRECCNELGIDEMQVKYKSTEDDESEEIIKRVRQNIVRRERIRMLEAKAIQKLRNLRPGNINIPSMINKDIEQ